MTPEGQALADAELANTDAAIIRAKGRTQSWLRQELKVAEGEQLPNVPYWNSDLKYPNRGAQELEWWRVHKIAAHRTPVEQSLWTDSRYTGLDPQQISDFQFAAKVRDQMVNELRKEQRVDGSLPPAYTQVMKPR